MMILKNLFSKVVVDAFVVDERISKLFPIDNSVKYMPEWFKNLPPKHENFDPEYKMITTSSTIRRCPAEIRLFKESFTIPLWTDLSIKCFDDGGWSYKAAHDLIEIHSHPRNQYGETFDNYIHMKILSPWLLKTKSNIDFVFHDALWDHVDGWKHFRVVTGIIDYKYQCETNINVFFLKQERQYMFGAGMPLVFITPMTEKKVKIKRHVISESEHAMILRNTSSLYFFDNPYQKTRTLLERLK